MTVPSPCISVCKMDAASGMCAGCGRTSDEIVMWLYMSDEEKARVLEKLEQRRQEVAGSDGS